MTMLEEIDIDYPYTVRVTRPEGSYDTAGNFAESFTTVIETMTADIQLSLQVRTIRRENETGVDDDALWMLYCRPPVPLRAGDRVHDGDRAFAIEAVGDWGSHTECVMRGID